MKTGYVISDQEKPHFITATVVDWIDIFTRKNYRDIIINCLDYCIKNKGMVLFWLRGDEQPYSFDCAESEW